MRRISSRSWVSPPPGGELGFGPVPQVGGGLDVFPVGEQLLKVGLEHGQVSPGSLRKCPQPRQVYL